MFKFQGKLIDITTDLTIGEGDAAITHPAANLQNPATRAELGIEDVVAPGMKKLAQSGAPAGYIPDEQIPF